MSTLRAVLGVLALVALARVGQVIYMGWKDNETRFNCSRNMKHENYNKLMFFICDGKILKPVGWIPLEIFIGRRNLKYKESPKGSINPQIWMNLLSFSKRVFSRVEIEISQCTCNLQMAFFLIQKHHYLQQPGVPKINENFSLKLSEIESRKRNENINFSRPRKTAFLTTFLRTVTYFFHIREL